MKKKDGYVLDTIYPTFFYKEMQPLWLNTVVSFLGSKVPNIESNFNYLELACGTGTNLLVCATNHPQGYFVGIDFNQQHIEKAKQAAQEIGLKNIEFIHCDFATFLENNHQKFDFIVNHGTYSWVAPQHQNSILKIVEHALNPSGIFYLHYMCYPGSADLMSAQKLLALVDQHTKGSSLESAELGKRLFTDLNKAGAFVNNPKIDAVMKSLHHSAAYLAHEFLTDYWQPLYSVDVHQQVFNTARMTYLGSANPCDNLESISIPEKMQHLVKNMQAPALKEYMKDLARDAKQRIDIFQNQPQIFKDGQHIKALNSIEFKILPNAPKQGGITFHTPIGEIKAPPELITPLLESLNQGEKRFDELLNLPQFKNNPMLLIETIFLMMNAQYLHPVSNVAQDVNPLLIEKFNQKMKAEGMSLNIEKDCATAL